jgi:hypothetical protein
MKAFFLSLLMVCTVSIVSSQTTSYGSFKLDNQEIIYQKVFTQDSITLDKLAEYYQTLPYISDVSQSSEQVTFDFNDLVVDYKKFQFAQVATPPIIQTGKFSGRVSASIKDGKYRLTIRSIQMTGDTGYKKITTKENLTNYSCENNGTSISQNWTKPNTLGLLEKAFTDKLQFVGKKKDDGDW